MLIYCQTNDCSYKYQIRPVLRRAKKNKNTAQPGILIKWTSDSYLLKHISWTDSMNDKNRCNAKWSFFLWFIEQIIRRLSNPWLGTSRCRAPHRIIQTSVSVPCRQLPLLLPTYRLSRIRRHLAAARSPEVVQFLWLPSAVAMILRRSEFQLYATAS